jgi:ABC-type uncharacterized transport system permease subunit
MILNGWKEIARYLGAGVRTAQRWEKLGLPIRRPHAHLGSAVVVLSEDVDSWVSQCSNGRKARIPDTPSNMQDCVR